MGKLGGRVAIVAGGSGRMGRAIALGLAADELAQAAILMASVPPHVNVFQAIVMPVGQIYVGRG